MVTDDPRFGLRALRITVGGSDLSIRLSAASFFYVRVVIRPAQQPWCRNRRDGSRRSALSDGDIRLVRRGSFLPKCRTSLAIGGRVRQTLAANRALQTDALGSLLSPTPASTLLVVRRVKHIRRHLSTLRATMPRHLGGGRPSHHVVSLPLRRFGAEIIAIAASISSA